MSDSPEDAAADTAPEASADLFAGIDMTATYPMGNQPVEAPGQPEQAEAVEAEAEAEATPEEAETAESATEEETQEPEPKVNFDGFSDESKSLYERLLKEGQVTPAEVEHERKNSMFQADYTRKRMAEAEEAKALKARYADHDEDLRLIQQIRSDDRLNAAWNKLSSEGVEAEDAEELATNRSAEQIALDVLQRERAKEQEQIDLQARTYAEKEQAIQSMLAETRATLGIDKETLVSYLNAEEAKLAPGTNPVESIAPEEWQRRLIDTHERMSDKSRIAALEKQLKQKTTKAENSAKQSLPPPASVSNTGEMDLYQQTMADLQLDPVKPNVTGLGHGHNR